MSGTGDALYLEAHEELLELHLLKSGGYGTGADPLANFVAIAQLTGEPAWRYPRRRALEKLARMESLERQGRIDELEEEHLDVASLMLCAEALRRRPDDRAAADAERVFGDRKSRGPRGPLSRGRHEVDVPAVPPAAAGTSTDLCCFPTCRCAQRGDCGLPLPPDHSDLAERRARVGVGAGVTIPTSNGHRVIGRRRSDREEAAS